MIFITLMESESGSALIKLCYAYFPPMLMRRQVHLTAYDLVISDAKIEMENNYVSKY